jgi:hypothetical protein
LCEFPGGKKRTSGIILSGAIAPVLNQPHTIQYIIHAIFSFRSSYKQHVSRLSPICLNEETVLVTRFIIAHKLMKKYDTVFL